MIFHLFDFGLGTTAGAIATGTFFLGYIQLKGQGKTPEEIWTEVPLGDALLDLGDKVTDIFDFWDAWVAKTGAADFKPYQMVQQWFRQQDVFIDKVKGQKIANDIDKAWKLSVHTAKKAAGDISQHAFRQVEMAIARLEAEGAQEATA